MSARKGVRLAAFAAVLAMVSLTAGPAAGGSGSSGGPPDGGAGEYWSAQRRAAAEPRDLVVDDRGLAYLRRADGSLDPHGHRIAAQQGPLRAVPSAKPSGPSAGGGAGGSTDTTGPVVGAIDPAAGATIGATHTFSAVITDDSGVRSATFEIRKGTASYSFAASAGANDTWSVSLQGFSDGEWDWNIVAKDNAKKGGNTTTTDAVPFTVDTTPDDGGSTGGGGGGDGVVVTNAEWTGGAVQTAAGRIYFQMPANRKHTRWTGYVCSGTVVTDGAGGRSVILTAAHCVYDDVNKAFARNVLFIPNQAATTGTRTDTNCDNDPLGCWEPDFGVVDTDWTSRTFPDNIPWDYAYYVVADPGHTGFGTDTALDSTAGNLPMQFSAPDTDVLTHALGYSYSDDPNFMYCAEAMGTEGSANWWLPSCELSGGSSGGPWVQPMTESTGSGPIISVNSWGYTNSPGMAGPKLSGTSAECLFTAATSQVFDLVSDRGIASSCGA